METGYIQRNLVEAVALVRRQRSYLVPRDPTYWFHSRLMRFVVSVSSNILHLLFHQSMSRSRTLCLSED